MHIVQYSDIRCEDTCIISPSQILVVYLHIISITPRDCIGGWDPWVTICREVLSFLSVFKP